MNTPIVDFVKNYNESNIIRMHMPGHKGAAFLGFENRDITEIQGADSLYHADGIIAESENNASNLFGSGKTLFSTEGSSICIKAMLYLALLNWKKEQPDTKPVIIASRNVHTSFIHAAMLLDIDVKWLWPNTTREDYNLLSCTIDLDSLKNEIQSAGDALIAIYVTSPDYLGNVADIESIAKVCHSNSKLLLVDNAHGAYLKFLPEDASDRFRHPLDLGADMCCDSAHKTLPVLTGGAYLHINKYQSEEIYNKAKLAMNIFGSTSPSYLILQSLDKCNAYIDETIKSDLKNMCKRIAKAKETIRNSGINIIDSDPLKITIKCHDGMRLAAILRENKIECEYSDRDFVVLMLTPFNNSSDIDNLVSVLVSVAEDIKSLKEDNNNYSIENGEICKKKVMTIREAMLMPSEIVKVENALGRICGAPLVSCPPAIPIVISGEIIDTFAISTFKRYNVEVVECIKCNEQQA